MGRSSYQFRDTQLGKKRRMNPIWRGIGFLVLVALTIGGFMLAGYLLELNWKQPFLPITVPRAFEVRPVDWLPPVPGKLLLQIGATLVLDVLAYAAMVFGYGILNPVRPGPTDAPQPRARGRRSMTR